MGVTSEVPELSRSGPAGAATSHAPSPHAASVQAERVLVRAAVCVRLGALVMLLNTVNSAPHPVAVRMFAGLAVVALLETIWYVRAIHRAGVVSATLTAIDTLTFALLLWPAGALIHAVDPAVGSPGYNYMMIGATVVGLAHWRPWSALAASSLLSVATFVSAYTAPWAGADAGGWSAIPDTLSPMVMTGIVLVITGLLRSTAAAVDGYGQDSVASAAALARERERIRHAGALGGSLVETLADLVDHRAVDDPVVRDQLVVELSWLREMVDQGPGGSHPAGNLTLGCGLRDVIAQKAAGGMSLDLSLPPEEPTLPAASVRALLEATREALTNVAKHAGTLTATVRVATEAGGVAVRVRDEGRGFDPRAVPMGFGLSSSICARTAEAGGSAEVDSRLGGGTTVRLWVPR